MMEKLSPAQLLKQEMMQRYGLNEDQVNIKLEIKGVELDLGKQIAADFDKYGKWEYFAIKKDLEVVHGDQITQTSVFLKGWNENADS